MPLLRESSRRVLVMTHQDTTTSATNFSMRFAIRAASLGVVVCEDLYQTWRLPCGLVPMEATIGSYLGLNPLIAARVHSLVRQLNCYQYATTKEHLK